MSDAAIQHALAELVPRGARVLDLGCGDGAMLDYLQRTRACTGYGVELDGANVLALFEDASFDVVLQIDTLQHLRNAETMLRETVRVGRVGIVAFPNFAHWHNRLSVLRGRMPVTKRLPYQWYDTPNIRVGTHADLAMLAQRNGLRVLDSFGLQEGRTVRFAPNLLAGTSVYKLAA
jgi:methionine biosynthesis protein MetW